MLVRLLRLYRCSRHVPLPQLSRRLVLNVKRRLMVWSKRRPLAVRSAATLPVRDRLPVSIFKPRRHLVRQTADSLFLCHLGRDFSLESPVDWMLERTRHTHLERLALHYHEFLESMPFADGLRLILDWIAANPPWRPGYWLDRWNSYAVSIRCVCWMQWIAEHRECLSRPDWNTIVGSLGEQVKFLERNLETDICGNHLIKNIRCLMWAAAFFDDSESAQRSQIAQRLLRWQLPMQFPPDGVHFELSPAYHCQVFGDLVECLAVASESVRVELLEVLNRAAQVIVDLTHPDGLISLMSDGGLHMVYSPAELLHAFAAQGGLSPSPREHFSFRNSGYFGFRSTRSYLLFDCGLACADSLPAHGHADILAMEWDVDGQRFLVDAGVCEYESGAQRTRFRSVVSHNTVQVGSRDQVEFVGSFRVGRRARGVCTQYQVKSDGVSVSGHHDGFSAAGGQVVHYREIAAQDGRLRIQDRVAGNTSEAAVSRLLLHDQCRVVESSERTLEVLRGRTRVRLTSTVPFRIVEAVWSPDFGQVEPTKCVELLLGNVPCLGEVLLEIV